MSGERKKYRKRTKLENSDVTELHTCSPTNAPNNNANKHALSCQAHNQRNPARPNSRQGDTGRTMFYKQPKLAC